jgi:hypothetical protein
MRRIRIKGDYNNYYGNSEVPIVTYSKCNWSNLPPPIGCLELIYLLANDRREVAVERTKYLNSRVKKEDRKSGK